MFGQNGLDAFNFAQKAHDGQKRKYIEIDYVVHPMRVASLVAHYLDVEHNPVVRDTVIPAALLHDVVEDTPVTYEELVEKFERPIADLVMEITNPSINYPDLNRGNRKEMDRHHLTNSSYFGASIKLADIIDNCTDIVAYDPGFASTYLKEKWRALEVLRHGNKRLFGLAEQTVFAGMDRI